MGIFHTINSSFRLCARLSTTELCSRGVTPIRSLMQNARPINFIPQRCFATSEDKKQSTVSRSSPQTGPTRGGPMSWVAVAIFTCIVAAGVYFVKTEKKKKDDEIAKNMAKYVGKVGKALIGGSWELVNYDGKLVSWRDYVGKWLIIYFGFTHCPDICPEELEKLINVVETLKKDPTMPKVHPLFFTVDPYRDTPQNIKEYCHEYSPDLMGFSGSVEQVSKVCKTFRVYFSEGPKVDNDYIVDHSIVMYLMNPEGEFVDHYTRETPEKRMEIKVRKEIKAYEEAKKA